MEARTLIDDARWQELLDTRATGPDRIARAFTERRRRPLLRGAGGRLFLVALDSAGGVGATAHSRRDLLGRALAALAEPGVDGIVAAADVMEDLLLLGGLEDRVAIGAMNRNDDADGIDDALTAYDARSIAESRLEGGRMRLRLAQGGKRASQALAAGARALTTMASRRIVALVEPAAGPHDPAVPGARPDADLLIRAARAASSLGVTSAYSWLLVPSVPDVERIVAATTLPVLLLVDPAADAADWTPALAQPQVRGIIADASLLFPSNGDPARAARATAALVHD